MIRGRLGGVPDNSILVKPYKGNLTLASVLPTGCVTLIISFEDRSTNTLRLRRVFSSPSWIISCLKCADPGFYAQPGDVLASKCIVQDPKSLLYVTEQPANKLSLQKSGSYNQLWTFYAQ